MGFIERVRVGRRYCSVSCGVFVGSVFRFRDSWGESSRLGIWLSCWVKVSFEVSMVD